MVNIIKKHLETVANNFVH